MLKQSLLKLLILSCSLIPFVSVEILVNSPVEALPGESTKNVVSWIRSHPTLQPKQGERLSVRKSDTAAQRFTFEASILPPGRIVFTEDRVTIRTESLTIFDAVNGITVKRLQESLRIIYNLDVYQDYDEAQIIYQYPSQSEINTDRLAKIPLREAIQGELRVGERYAYWLEIAQPKQGKAIIGNITVLLKADANKLEAELRTR
jgi:hypothetical protein